MLLCYNEELFKAAKVELPTDKWTLDNYTEAAKQLHKPPDVFAMTAFRNTQLMLGMILQNGGRPISDDEKKCLLDTPEVVEVVQWGVDTLQKHKVSMEPGSEERWAISRSPVARSPPGSYRCPTGVLGWRRRRTTRWGRAG